MSNAPDLPELHFLVSAPRSGSTWLTSTLDQHPDILGVEQRLFGGFHEMWTDHAGRPEARFTLDHVARCMSRYWMMPTREVDRTEVASQLLNAWCDALSRLGAARSGKSIIVDKITPYSGTARAVRSQIRRHRPESKVIHLSRDGRDVVTSLVFDWIHREPSDSPRRRLLDSQTPGICLDRFFTDDDLIRWGGLWLEIEDSFTSLPDQLEVRYEALKNDTPRQIIRILEYLGVSHELDRVKSMCDATSFDKMKRVSGTSGDSIGKARRGIVGDWKQYFTRRDGEILEAVTQGKLVAMGYVESAGWWEHCPARVELSSLMES